MKKLFLAKKLMKTLTWARIYPNQHTLLIQYLHLSRTGQIASTTGIYASFLFLKMSLALADSSASRGLNSFSTSPDLAVASGAVPTLLVDLGASMVSIDATSREAYQE